MASRLQNKQTLLTFLKRSHGESTEGPRKITLKRKTISTLKTGSGSGKKTVNIEVRKKRTYVKRSAADEAEREDANVLYDNDYAYKITRRRNNELYGT